MNPVFYLLVVITAIVLWALLAFIFYPLGKFVYRIISDAIHELNRDDEDLQRKDEEK